MRRTWCKGQPPLGGRVISYIFIIKWGGYAKILVLVCVVVIVICASVFNHVQNIHSSFGSVGNDLTEYDLDLGDSVRSTYFLSR